MPLPISSDQIAGRLRDFPHDNYIYMGSILKGISLSIGTAAAFQICLGLPNEAHKITPWIASLVATLVTFTTWHRGILVTNSRGTKWDAILPLLMGIAEFVLFAILLKGNSPNEDIWLYWLFALSLHAFFAVCLVINRLRNSRVDEDFDSDVRPIGALMHGWIKQDLIGASSVTLAALLCGLVVQWVRHSSGNLVAARWQSGMAFLFIAILWGVVCQANNQRHRIDDMVSEIEIAKKQNRNRDQSDVSAAAK